jgi:purine-binding chemotaxis protein CheW
MSAAERLRRQFDASFAAPPAAAAASLDDLLLINVGPQRYALRLTEIRALHADLKIVSVPGPRAELLGVVGLRGAMVPIYDLALLLRQARALHPRWIALAQGADVVGFAFDAFESHLRVPASALAQGDGESKQGSHRHGAVHVLGAVVPIIHLTSILFSPKGSPP